MQRILLLLIIVFSAITASAQPFGGRWMTANGANGTDCLWFRRTFIAKERPYRAAVTVAADCRYVAGTSLRRSIRPLTDDCRPAPPTT